MEELEDEASHSNAELQRRDRAAAVAIGAGAPLGIKADDEVVEAAAMDPVDVRDPVVDGGGGVGNGSEDAALVHVEFCIVVNFGISPTHVGIGIGIGIGVNY